MDFGEDRDGFCRKSVTAVRKRHQVKGHLKREGNEKGKCREGAEWEGYVNMDSLRYHHMDFSVSFCIFGSWEQMRG